jgi:large subunit ribosomal protein L46
VLSAFLPSLTLSLVSLQLRSRALATEAISSTAGEAVRPKKGPPLATAVILNRAPIITRTPTLFERAYYNYQARIQRALHNPFPYDFYFKQGSLLETRFNLEERRRERKAFGRPFSLHSVPGVEENPETLRQLGPQEGENETTMPRRHEADKKNDVRSLDRQGQRNLYLLLMSKEGGNEVWRFPQGEVGQSEFLHQASLGKCHIRSTQNDIHIQAAQRSLLDECGSHIDTWVVSRNPVGVYKPPSPNNQPDESSPEACLQFPPPYISLLT